MPIYQDYYIRSVRAEDADDLYDLCSQLGYSISKDDIKLNIQGILGKSDYVVYVAVSPDEKVIGCIQAQMSLVFYSKPMIEVNGLVVDKNYRKKGIGNSLLKQIELFARERNCTFINLRANVIRKEAHEFYKKLGYEEIKRQVNFRKEL